MCRPSWRIEADSSELKEVLKYLEILKSLGENKVSKKLKDSFQKEFDKIIMR